MTPALADLGWDDHVAAGFVSVTADDEPGRAGERFPGRVARVDRGSALALTERGPVVAAAERRPRRDDLPAVGDWLVLRPGDRDGSAVLDAVLPRRSEFVRGDPSRPASAQVVAANVDTVFVVHAFGSAPKLRRLERELVLAWESGAQPVVLLTKRDRVDDAEADAAVAGVRAVARDVPVHALSARTGDGVDVVHRYTVGHRTVALIGASGVGKSTLVNRIVGDERQETGEVRERDQRGRHTTVARELLLLPDGGLLIDTPGMRSVALWHGDDGMAKVFGDLDDLATRCRFNDCAHEGDPGCAIEAEIGAGRLDRARAEHWAKLHRELDHLADAGRHSGSR